MSKELATRMLMVPDPVVSVSVPGSVQNNAPDVVQDVPDLVPPMRNLDDGVAPNMATPLEFIVATWVDPAAPAVPTLK
jgi:hypothetical protein